MNARITLILLGMLLSGCTTPKFTVRAVDSVSGSPIPRVNVVHREDHWIGFLHVQDSTHNRIALGMTDAKGKIGIYNLHTYSRTHALEFKKPGYEDTYLMVNQVFIREGYEPQSGYVVAVRNDEPVNIGDPIPIKKAMVYDVPMRRE